jgi:acylphosphatase
MNRDGRLEVLATGTDTALNHIWQTAAGGAWTPREGLGGGITKLAESINEDGRLEAFAIGTDAVLNHIWQIAPGSGTSGRLLRAEAGVAGKVLWAALLILPARSISMDALRFSRLVPTEL